MKMYEEQLLTLVKEGRVKGLAKYINTKTKSKLNELKRNKIKK